MMFAHAVSSWTIFCVCVPLFVLATPVPQSVADAPVLGGLSNADVNDEYVKNAAAVALNEIDKRQNSAYTQVLVQLLSAKTQVVEGKLYHLQLEVGTSNCRKGQDHANSECSLKENSNNQLCDVKVWERSWLNDTHVTELSCNPKSRVARGVGIPGGLSDADVNDENIKDVAKFALSEVDNRSNSAYKQKLVRIVKAQSQVVSGSLYHLQLEVGESSCEKGSNKADSECSLREGSSNQTCNVKVWDRPWLKERQVTELECTA